MLSRCQEREEQVNTNRKSVRGSSAVWGGALSERGMKDHGLYMNES